MNTTHKIILGLSITLMAGYTWSLDMPLALEVPLRQSPFNFSNFDFSLLYFATYIPVCFLDVSIGMLLDRVSIKKAAIWITLICLLSEVGLLLAFHFLFQGYKVVLYLCRGIFGVTGSGLFTVQALLITKYGGKHYDTLIGIGVCIPFLFDSIQNTITPLIFDQTGSMELVWLVGVGFCSLAFITSIFISKLMNKEEEQSNSLQKQQIQNEQVQEPFSLKGLKKMKKEFWVLIGAILFFELCISSYMDNLNDTLVKRFQFSYVTAGYLLFIPYGMSAIGSYFIGKVLDKNANSKRKIVVFGAILFSVGIFFSYLLPNIEQKQSPPTYYYFLISFQFITISFMMSLLYGCLSSSIKYVVDEKYLGMSWGVIGTAIGLAEAMGPVIAAGVLQSTENLADGYKRLALVVFLISLVAIQFSLWILYGPFQKIDIISSECISIVGLQDSLLDDKIQKSLQTTQTID